MTHGSVPLPTALDGTDETRTVRIDRALLFVVGGALTRLMDTPVMETGTLTEGQFRAIIQDMLKEFYGWDV